MVGTHDKNKAEACDNILAVWDNFLAGWDNILAAWDNDLMRAWDNVFLVMDRHYP